MRRQVLIGIAACFYYSGMVALARWVTQRSKSRLIVLNYHRATGGNLLRHLLYLRHHYSIVPVEKALEELYAPFKKDGNLHDKRTPLVLTFDDGYRDNYTHGYALARDLQIPFTIYLIPGYLDNRTHFWWLEGKHLVKHAGVDTVTLDGRTFNLNSSEDRSYVARFIDAGVRYASSVQEREQFLADMRAAFAVSPEQVDEDDPSLPLSWDEVREMDASGLVSFGAHTMHHPILAFLADQEEVRSEVVDCRAALEKQLGHPVRTFAYPVGQAQHVSCSAVEMVQKAGFIWAFTTMYGINTPECDPYLLKRVEVDVDQHWLVVAAEAAGLWGFFSRLRWLPFIRKNFTNTTNAVR
ncbi:MAG TPA: polysaccharide deacetylase family protein [Ktedonobacteraceae bacterium]